MSRELAIESAMYNMNVRSTIDNWRERISNGLLGFSFVVSRNEDAPLVGGLLGDYSFCVYQRNNVKKYLEKYGVDDENNSSSSSSSSRRGVAAAAVAVAEQMRTYSWQSATARDAIRFGEDEREGRRNE